MENVPAGLEHLETIINAIKGHHILRMGYQKFRDSEPYTTLIEPYCLKLFHQRWYLLGKSERKNNDLAVFALDRMTELTETDEQFKLDPRFDAETFFKDYFGVYIGEKEPPQRIVLRTYGIMVHYLNTLPLHPSQKEINKTEYFSDFEYFLVPSFDFQQAIL